MNLKESLQALVDGHKVRNVDWPEWEYVVACGNRLLDENGRSCTIGWSSDEWEIYKEPPKEYNFLEAVKMMKDGKKMKRKDWVYTWIASKDGMIRNTAFSGSVDYCSIKDILATDWIVVE